MRFVGIGLGDDRFTTVMVDETGAILAQADPAPAAEALATAVQDSLRTVQSGAPADGIGTTFPFQSDSLPPEVATAIRSAAGAEPVAISAGHAMTLAESWCGAARGCHDVITFAIGEHVTAGILMNGKLVTGANGHAGSVAWLALNPVEREDYRRHGGLEAEVAAAGIVRRLVWRIKSGDTSRVLDRTSGDLTSLTAADVIAAARDGDGVCASVVRDTAKYVGMAIANVVTFLDPQCVVLGGTLASSGDLMLDAIRTECSRRLRPAQWERVRIELSTLGAAATAVGAARAAMLQRR